MLNFIHLLLANTSANYVYLDWMFELYTYIVRTIHTKSQTHTMMMEDIRYLSTHQIINSVGCNVYE